MNCSSICQFPTPTTRVRVFFRRAALYGAFLIGLSWGRDVSAQAAAAGPVDRDAFLRAISEVETGGNSRAVGRAGERGMFQFRRQTWQQHTTRSFFEAHNPSTARMVASRHFEWLLDGFHRNGRSPTPYLLAAAWNAGLSKALSGSVPRTTRDYARRVSNIVASLSPAPKPVTEQRFLIATTE